MVRKIRERKTSGARAVGKSGDLAPRDGRGVKGGIRRSMPDGKTDVIKAMGNTKWSDIELKP